jgi:hypothetical protein
MHCTLLIPRLFGPRDTVEALSGNIGLPALDKLLGRARAERLPATTAEAWLSQQFEVERQQDWPIAPLTLEYDDGDAGNAYWLRADPVHLRVERDGLILIENAFFDLSGDEAHALVSALNEHFAQDVLSFHAPVPKRWYAKLERTPKLVTSSTAEVAGQDVNYCLPVGDDALAWHRIFNEVQMLLHSHTVNEARDARGQPAVNSVWFWGGGMRPALRGRPYDAVWSDDVTALALATAAKASAENTPGDAAAWLARSGTQDSHLVVMTALARAAAYHDSEAWSSALEALETRWFAPLAQALRARRVARVTLVVPGASSCWRFDVTTTDLLKFWRSSKRWSEYA